MPFPFLLWTPLPKLVGPEGRDKKRVSLRAPNSKYQSLEVPETYNIEKPVNRSLGSCRRMEGDSLVYK